MDYETCICACFYGFRCGRFDTPAKNPLEWGVHPYGQSQFGGMLWAGCERIFDILFALPRFGLLR